MRTVVLLEPGESRLFECHLDVGSMPEGEYTVQVNYHATYLLGITGNLTSNVVRFRIER